MKRIITFFLITIIILGGISAGAWFWYKNATDNPMTDGAAETVITVRENEGLYSLLGRLEEEGKLRSAEAARIYYRLSDKDLGIKPGRHIVKAGGNLQDLLEALKSGDRDERTVSIPEGFNIGQMGEAFEKAGIFKKEDFIKAVKEFPLPSYVKKVEGRRYAMEGFLKPDTYIFRIGTDPSEAIKIMSDAFRTSFEADLKDLGMELPEDKWDETVIKASMIERETATEDEMPIVASVIENRLSEHMPLQIDATILYAVNDPHREITMDDILLDNPYNTYYTDALPIGPICSPSSSSIKAALKPEKTDYIFYVLNPKTGRHYFTKDYDDFMVKRDDYMGYSTVPAASTPDRNTSQASVPSPSTSKPGYSSNTLKEDKDRIIFPKLSVPDNFMKIKNHEKADEIKTKSNTESSNGNKTGDTNNSVPGNKQKDDMRITFPRLSVPQFKRN